MMNVTYSIKLISFSLLTLLVDGCSAQSEAQKISEIMTGIRITGMNYEHSDESKFNLGNEQYSLRKKAFYSDNGIIQKLIIYKSEGLLEYSKEEIEKNMALLEYSGIPFKQNGVYESKKLTINEVELKGEFINSYWVSQKENDMVTIYRLE